MRALTVAFIAIASSNGGKEIVVRSLPRWMESLLIGLAETGETFLRDRLKDAVPLPGPRFVHNSGGRLGLEANREMDARDLLPRLGGRPQQFFEMFESGSRGITAKNKSRSASNAKIGLPRF